MNEQDSYNKMITKISIPIYNELQKKGYTNYNSIANTPNSILKRYVKGLGDKTIDVIREFIPYVPLSQKLNK